MAQSFTQSANQPATTRLDLTLLGKSFSVQCDEGEEARVEALAGYVDGKLRQLSGSQSSATENRLLMLCCLMLADEVFEARSRQEGKSADTPADNKQLEDILVAAVDDLNRRLNGLAERLAAV